MLSTLITSKTRIKLLIKFFINGNVNGYLRSLESEFGESCNAIRIELNRFVKEDLLISSMSGNKKIYSANTKHPFYKDLQIFLHKIVGIDFLVKEVIQNIPNLQSAFLTGKLAQGIDSQIFDLVLIGDKLDKSIINKLIEDFEQIKTCKIRTLILNPKEKKEFLNEPTAFKIWENEKELTSITE